MSEKTLSGTTRLVEVDSYEGQNAICVNNDIISSRLNDVYRYYYEVYNSVIELDDSGDYPLTCIDVNGNEMDYYDIEYTDEISSQDALIAKMGERFTAKLLNEDILRKSPYRVNSDGKIVHEYKIMKEFEDVPVNTSFETLYISNEEVVINVVDWYIGEGLGNIGEEAEKFNNSENYLTYAVSREFSFVNENNVWKLDSISER